MSIARYALVAFLVVGCGRNQPKLGPAKPPEVQFALAVERTVIEYEEFTGRTEASKMVDIRARVTGYLGKANFKDGANVAVGDVLFEIDPRTYQAEYDRAAANQSLAEARLARLDADYERAEKLLTSNAMSVEEHDRIAGDRFEAQASLRVAKASVESARLNLGFTKVISPLTGRISRTLIDPGNLVKADDTLLTTIVAQDPVFAYFDVDERTLLRLRRLVQSGKIRSARQSTVNVEMGLTDEEGYPQAGTIDFIDNRVEATTGTLRVRGVFPNPRGMLSPGLFVRVRMPVGDPKTAILIPEQALASDQGQRYVYVIDNQSTAQYRKVSIGSPQGPDRVINAGLVIGDRVVVSGLQRVRPGMIVDAKPIEPTAAGPQGRSASSTITSSQ